MSMTNKPVEPSMEEILASIRKIIAEEPIGTRPDPVNQHAAKASPRLDAAQKPNPAPEALAMDDVLDMAGAAGRSPSGGARDGTPANGTAGGKPVTPQASQPIEARAASNDAARANEVKSAAGERATSALGATVPERKAELETPPERAAAQSVDAALSEAQKKVERHFGSLPEPAERPAPLGLRSVRDPLRDVKPAGGLMSRVAAAAQAVATDAVADKVRGVNGATGAAATSATAATAKQEEATPAAKTVTSNAAAAAKPAGSATSSGAVQSETAKTAAGPVKASLEEAVAEMLRPMLNTWLEANLPRIVEQVVREHVAKTPVPGQDKPAA